MSAQDSIPFVNLDHGMQSEWTAVPSFVSDFLEKKNTIGASQQEEEAIEYIAYTVYGGKDPLLSISVRSPVLIDVN